jgi:hypothetical protein
MSIPFGEEPSVFKVLVYNQLSPEEVAKANIDIKKVSFWDITASVPGSNAVEDPHVSVYWYGPKVSIEKGRIIHMKGHKLEEKFTDPIKRVVAAKVGGTENAKEGGVEFKDFTMKMSYSGIADLAKAIQSSGKLSCECTLEYEMVTKEERSASNIGKARVLGEKALEK